MSSVTGGEHMIPVLNEIGIHSATLGNHDFDFGMESCQALMGETSCAPWMLANIIDEEGKPIVGATPSKLFDWNGVKVGLVGVVESEWMDTTICFDSSVKYVDQVEVATKIARELREEGAQIVIAVTHSRGPNDILLAQHVDGIDLILGGHDHDYYLFHANGIPILNSGSDFKQMTLVEVTLKSETKEFSTDAEEIDTSCKDKTSWDLDGRRAKFTLHRYDVTS